MGGKSPQTLSAEFAVSRQLNPRLAKAVYHSSLSLPKIEHLDDDTWNAIADEYLEGMEFNDSQYVVYRHSDKDHDHVHIVASRIRITDGTTVNDSWDYVRSEKLIRELEHKYELTPTVSSNQKQQRGTTSGEMRLIERTGEASIKTKLIQIIDAETEKPMTMPELVNQLKNQGINALVSFTRTEKVRGISYQLDGVATSGTHLGRAYTFPGLQKHKQVSYDHNLHHLELIKASNRPPIIKTDEQEEQEKARQTDREQIERSLIIAPILRDYVNGLKQTQIEISDYRISWQKKEKTLYLYKKPEAEPKFKIKYENQEFSPIESASTTENQPTLTNADVNYWLQKSLELHLYIKQKKRQQEKEQKIKKRVRRR